MDTTNNPEQRSFWLPTRPYNLIAAVNRMAAATGSMRYAALTTEADYNGHHVSLAFNDYRQYWVAEYFWAGRVVLARGTFRECLKAAKQEYDRGALGCTVMVYVTTDEDAASCLEMGFQPFSKEAEGAHFATWRDARFAEINDAFWYEKHTGCPAVGYLANSATVEEYRAKVDAFNKEQKARTVASRQEVRS